MKKLIAVLAFAGLSLSGFARMQLLQKSIVFLQTLSGAIGLFRLVLIGMLGIQTRSMVRISQQVLSRSSVLILVFL